MKYLKSHYSRWKAGTGLFLIILAVQALVLLPRASAGSLTNTFVRFDRMSANTQTTGTVCAQPATVGTETDVKVTFPTNYTLGTAANFTVSTTNLAWPTGGTAWLGINTATNVTGQLATFPSSDLTVGTLYCFNWSSSAAVKTNAATANDQTGSVTTEATGPVTIDSGNYATSTVGNDQIAVTASVNASFTFSLSSNSATLGALSTSGPTAAPAINASVSTNARSGWQMWAKDPTGTPGLTSTTAGKTIGYSPAANSAAAALSTGAEGYNVGAGTASGTTCTSVTTDPKFASGGTSFKGGGLDGTLRSLAVSTGVANACALPLTVNASISATTPAATDYSGTVTVVAAGLF